jgi:hypothetical protein
VGVTDTDVMQPGPVAKRELAALVDQVPSAAEADLDEAGVVLADAFLADGPSGVDHLRDKCAAALAGVSPVRGRTAPV